MRILALDLATKTGWAHWDGARIESGMQDFTKRRGESNGMLFYNFNHWLSGFRLPDLIAYEQPAIFRSGAANEIAVGLCTRVQEYGARNHIDYFPVPVMALKKWATGSGKASKVDMWNEANSRRFGKAFDDNTIPDRQIMADDNETDAFLLLAYAIEKFEGGASCNAQVAAAASIK